MSEAQSYLPFLSPPKNPKFRLPEGTCDAHFHFFEKDFEFSQPRSYTPSFAEHADYEELKQALGISTSVLVHPSVYGPDHTSFEAALARDPKRLRGVAVVYESTTETQLAKWNQLGSRGTRVNALYKGGAKTSDLATLAARVRPYSWHLQFLIDVSATPEVLTAAVATGVPVVVDHAGHPSPQALAMRQQDPGIALMLALLREGRIWVKLSGMYRLVRQDASGGLQGKAMDDIRWLFEQLLIANPAQCLWGTDWPHPSMGPSMPHDADLTDLLHDWLGAEALKPVFVDNPRRLYWQA